MSDYPTVSQLLDKKNAELTALRQQVADLRAACEAGADYMLALARQWDGNDGRVVDGAELDELFERWGVLTNAALGRDIRAATQPQEVQP